MNHSNKTPDEIREKIRKGLTLSFKKLLLQKSQNGGIIVLSKNGKIIKVKAADIKQ